MASIPPSKGPKRKLAARVSDGYLSPSFKSAEELGKWDESMAKVRRDLASQAMANLGQHVFLSTDFSGVDFAADAFRNSVQILAKAQEVKLLM